MAVYVLSRHDKMSHHAKNTAKMRCPEVYATLANKRSFSFLRCLQILAVMVNLWQCSQFCFLLVTGCHSLIGSYHSRLPTILCGKRCEDSTRFF